jgi:Domain of unknown function (DUF1992)
VSMPHWYEDRIDRQIREARERGEFDDLPGMGKPIPGAGEPYDENWWVKDLLRRENAGLPLPPLLVLRREVAELPGRLDRESSEVRVRALLKDLNERIAEARRGPGVAGVVVPDVDVEPAVAAWRRRRAG